MTNCDRSKCGFIIDTLVMSCFLLLGVLGIMLLSYVMENEPLQRLLFDRLRYRLTIGVFLPTVFNLMSTMAKRRSTVNALVNSVIPYALYLPSLLRGILPGYWLFLIVSVTTSMTATIIWARKKSCYSCSFYDVVRFFMAVLAVQQLICYAVVFVHKAFCESSLFCISSCSLLLILSSLWIIKTHSDSLFRHSTPKALSYLQRKELARIIRSIDQELKNNPWALRSTREKKRIVNEILEIESKFLGLVFSPQIVYTCFDTAQRTLFTVRKYKGAYHAETDRIFLDNALLNDSSIYPLLECLFHELRHAHQARQTHLLPYIPEEYHDLLLVRQIEQIAQEFDHYKDGTDSDAYHQQLCEQDAQSYAQEALYEYILLWR